jgi:purine-nucleoside phosphorylase
VERSGREEAALTAGPAAARVEEAVAYLRARGAGEPRAAVVLGSGLGSILAPDGARSIPFADIPGFPRGTVAGHAHRLELGEVAGVPVVVLRGRVHYYEGVDLPEITFPVRVVRSLGARWIALTNAAGGLSPSCRVGDLVILSDHLNLLGDNPLIGPNEDGWGPRFPDMSGAYCRSLARRAEAAAREAGVLVQRGVYACVSGPTYETPAELRMLRALGADLVGMSTVPEAIAAVHGGMKVLGLSVVTDLASPEAPGPVSHEEVVAAAGAAAPAVEAILTGVIRGEA